MELFQLNSSHFNQPVMVKAKIIREEEDGDQVRHNFFTEENLCSLKFPTGDEFFTFLQSNAYSEGFKLVSEHSHDDTFIFIKCYQHNTKSPAYEKCNFKINLQAHNFNQPSQYYSVSSCKCLQHSHTLDPFLFVHLILSDETVDTIKSLSECNVDTIKIAEYIEKVKGISMTTAQIRYILKKKREEEIQTETEILEKKMNDEEGLAFVKPPNEINNVSYRRAIATFRNTIFNIK
ncbi:hypothetical protein M9Y10_001137 [Tritrichomonas musculus]|uniref:Uncharacterized protein n=1 Tax=Tritrichomonas musculus TaxID=1915356 RepID=A0ABR2L672_9EUKA